MRNTNSIFDAVIIGAGLAGCATAIGLLNMNPNLRLAMVERNALSTLGTDAQRNHPRIGETVPPQIEPLLKQLEILDAFKVKNYERSFGTAAVWGSDITYENEYLLNTAGYGYVVDRMDFDNLLLQQVRNRGVSFIQGSIYKADKQQELWKLHCRKPSSLDHELLMSRFVVDATGRKAAFATLAGSKKIKQDHLVCFYRSYSVISNKEAKRHRGTFIESAPMGWWYSNTLNNGTKLVAFMTDSDIAKSMNLKDPLVFDRLLQDSKKTNSRLASFKAENDPIITAANSQIISRSAGDAWLAVGDAASCYDPLSSLGMYKSLQSGLFASYAIYDFHKGNNLGLKKYEAIVQQSYKNYLHKKASYYAKEIRFLEHPFWQRRLIA